MKTSDTREERLVLKRSRKVGCGSHTRVGCDCNARGVPAHARTREVFIITSLQLSFSRRSCCCCCRRRIVRPCGAAFLCCRRDGGKNLAAQARNKRRGRGGSVKRRADYPNKRDGMGASEGVDERICSVRACVCWRIAFRDSRFPAAITTIA